MPFLAKVLEKIALHRITNHLQNIAAHELFQSAYKANHSTETALMRVQNDILLALDEKQCVVLLLLDLSAAFDTIDHQVLVDTLLHRMRIEGTALDWIRSYLYKRSQQVLIDDVGSEPCELQYGVPQGHVLGPALFCMYMSPLADILRNRNMMFHLYADDSQLYCRFDPVASQATIESIQSTVAEIKLWMKSHFLKLNEEKTELMLIRSQRCRFDDFPAFVDLGCETIIRI